MAKLIFFELEIGEKVVYSWLMRLSVLQKLDNCHQEMQRNEEE